MAKPIHTFKTQVWRNAKFVIVTYYAYESNKPVWPQPRNASFWLIVDGRE